MLESDWVASFRFIINLSCKVNIRGPLIPRSEDGVLICIFKWRGNICRHWSIRPKGCVRWNDAVDPTTVSCLDCSPSTAPRSGEKFGLSNRNPGSSFTDQSEYVPCREMEIVSELERLEYQSSENEKCRLRGLTTCIVPL